MFAMRHGSENAISNPLNIQVTETKSGAEARAAGAGLRATKSATRKAGRMNSMVRPFGSLLAGFAGVMMAVGFGVSAQAGVSRDGVEYRLAPALQGDQGKPDLALNATGGYLVWEDNVGDGDGLSVNLRRINSSMSGEFGVTGLATRTAGDQENPHVTFLNGGGAAFVWQGGTVGEQQVFLRIMIGAGTFIGDEIPVSAHPESDQTQPAVAGLANGNIVVVWSAQDLDGSMQGVFGAIFAPNGQRIGTEFQINQFTKNNQRTPVVAALPSGKFVVSWISEGQRDDSSVDLYARMYSANGTPLASEFRVNTSERVASSPAIGVTGAGGYTLAWSEAPQLPVGGDWVTANPDASGWDVYACTFTEAGRITTPTRVNQVVAGSQHSPSVATIGPTQMVVWSSFGQDGDRQGVVGRALSSLGTPEGNEFVVNTTTYGRQLQPVVRGNGDAHFLVAWTGFTGIATGMEIFSQRFHAEQANVVLPTPAAPYISPLTANRVSVAWPEVAGYQVASYELYVYLGGQPQNPIVVTNQMRVISGLAPGQTVTVELAYRLLDGMLSPRSPAANGKTWEDDINGGEGDGLPDDWQQQYWGYNTANWPSPTADSDGDGVSNRNEFLAGTNPMDSTSVLRTKFVSTPQGMRFSWNTNPGFVYQVQQTTDFAQWTDFGGQRFAPGTTDSVSVPGGNSIGYYRVIRIR